MARIPRCEILPLPGHQVSFLIDGREVTRWHFSPAERGPYFYPLCGPDSDQSLTRLGHPGAPDHDHHRSVWFAHNKVLGIDFWSLNTPARIQQASWLVYEDGDEAARMAVELHWLDGHDPQPLIRQELVLTLQPLADREYTLDLQSTFQPQADQLEFQQSNFGFLAVRVAKSLSAHFGGGTLTSESGLTGEQANFGQPAAWMDYSGPVRSGSDSAEPSDRVAGITYFDHPHNPAFPGRWHVREDGWMGLSACREAPLLTTRQLPLRLRYRLHVHRGPVDRDRAAALARDWSQQPWWEVARSQQPHRLFELHPASPRLPG